MINNLKEVRIQKCLSQRDLARLAGITTATIISIEHGRKHPQFITIRKLSKALGVDVTELHFD